MKYRILIGRDKKGNYIAEVPALPGCTSQGKTEEEAIENVQMAIALHLKSQPKHNEEM
jgi:predicted RNase H-like HicB family nuclease